MAQRKAHSLAESVTNVGIGFVVALISQILVFPLFDIHVTFGDNLGIAAWFTVISIVRSYSIRRWFTVRTE